MAPSHYQGATICRPSLQQFEQSNRRANIYPGAHNWIHFTATQKDANGLYRKRADGTGSEELLDADNT